MTDTDTTVTFHALAQNVLNETLGVSLGAFRTELVLCAAIIGLVLVRMILPRWRSAPFYVMFVGVGAGLYLLIPRQWLGPEVPTAQTIFTGMLVWDTFSVYMRGLVLTFLLLFALLTRISGFPKDEDATEFYVLVLGAALGMCLMVAANHMVIVILGMEMASVPSYVLAGMLRHRRQSTEAALKFAVFGAGAAGIMLYGMSLLVGVLGSAHLPTMASHLADMLRTGAGADQTMILVLGGLMMMAGLAFKLSAVPFHFWAPDVFEGATAEVALMLSVASKAAALGLLVRLTLAFSAAADPGATALLEPVRQFLVGVVALLAAITCTYGNLAAYGQTNMKRLLAYSTIAHAGYMMMPVAAAVALVGTDPAGARAAVGSLAVYLAIYLFMNLGAFSAVAFLRNATGSERIADYAGLIHRSPGLAVCFSIILFSLIGLPPLAGFTAKFNIFASLARFDARLLTLLVIGGVNTALSLFYYLRVVRVMTLQPEPEERRAPCIPLLSVPGAYCAAITVPVVVLGVWWGGLLHWAQIATATLLR